MRSDPAAWPQRVFDVLKSERVRVVSYVPDAGLRGLIELCRSDDTMISVALTNEEEGIGLSAGAWLGGERSVLLMQSSGVGKCVNGLAMIEECRFPFLAVVSMRGEWGEANPWQVPMARAVETVLEEMGVSPIRVIDSGRAADAVASAVRMAFESHRAVAVLLSQQMLGSKTFPAAEQAHD
ncbi:MAG TPA: phosphonopyruvate decarboxylase [Vicinamibacteria bacterium]|nr:phosphonopyruvate decarboxylase [Vicinamibacteria bacterium]